MAKLKPKMPEKLIPSEDQIVLYNRSLDFLRNVSEDFDVTMKHLAELVADVYCMGANRGIEIYENELKGANDGDGN